MKFLHGLLSVTLLLSLAGWLRGKGQAYNAGQSPPLVAQGEFNAARPLKAGKELIAAVAKDLKILESEAARLSFIKVPQGKRTLFVVKAPSNFCGAAGCLFLGYLDHRQVFSIYLIDRLPVGVNSFIAPKGPECIAVHSLRSYGSTSLVSKDFCLKGDRYR